MFHLVLYMIVLKFKIPKYFLVDTLCTNNSTFQLKIFMNVHVHGL